MKFPYYVKLACSLISVVLIIFLLEKGRDIFVPLFFGLLIALLLYPINRFLEAKLRLSKSIAALISVLFFVCCLATFGYFITFQVVNFTQDLPHLQLRFVQIYDSLHHWVTYKLKINVAQQNDYIDKSIGSFVETAGQSVTSLVISLTGLIFFFVFVLIFSYFILFHRKLLLKFTLNLFSTTFRGKVQEVVLETKSMINSYVVGLMIEMLIMSVANSTLLLLLGVKYPILLGVVAAVLNIIPYIGIYTAIVLIMLVTFANSTLPITLEAGVGMLILHFIDANIMLPRIIGARVKMNPFITIIAVIVGEFLWGIPGMFLFIPVTGIIKLVCERVEGMEAWALLIGVDEKETLPVRKITFADND